MALISLQVRIVRIPDQDPQIQFIRVADGAFGLVFEVGRNVFLEQLKSINDVGLRIA